MQLRILLMVAILPILTTAKADDTCVTTNSPSSEFPFKYTVCSDSIRVEEVDGGKYGIHEVKCNSEGAIVSDFLFMDHNSCEHLTPCTYYNVSVTAVISSNFEESNTTFTKVLQTSYSDPVSEITSLTPGDFSVIVSWKTTNVNCINRFIIKTLGEDFNVQQEVLKNNSLNNNYEYEFKNLMPCKNYNISVTTMTTNSSSSSTPEKPFTTKYADPGPIEKANLNVTDSHSAILAWSKPSRAPDCIQYYEVKWKASHCEIENSEIETESCIQSKNISVTDSLNIHFDDLEACETYRVDVNVNGDPVNNWNRYFDTPNEDLKVVENFTVDYLNKSLGLKWTPPHRQQFCIKAYTILAIGPEKNKTSTTDDTSFTVMDLKPCGTYNISIAALDKDGKEGKNITQTHKVLFEKPDRVEEVNIYPGKKHFYVIWRPPRIQELCVKDYRITAWENPAMTIFDITTPNTSVFIENLSSCTVYYVQIIPTAPEGDGNNCVVHDTTDPDLLGAPIVTLYEATHESLRINATVASDDNRCDIYYVRYNCETQEDARIKKGEATVSVPEFKKVFIATVQPLSPSKTYNCKVSIYNIKGWSENGTASMTTKLYYPEKPTNLTAISKTSKTVKVKWSPPRYPNGEIRWYEVHVQTIAPKYRIPPSCPPFLNPNIPSTISKKTEKEIEWLLPHIEYSIQVAAVNDFGTGDFTASVPVITKPDVSSVPSKAYEPVLKGPEVGKPYSANATISWDLPCSANGDIARFEGVVEAYRDSNEQHEIFSWSLPVTEEMITHQDTFFYTESRLKPEYNYTVRIGVVIKDVEIKSEECTSSFISPAGIPTDVPPAYADVDPVGATNPTTSAMIRFSKSLLYSGLGSIKYVALLISEKNCQDDPLLRTDVIQSENDWPSVLSWTEAHKHGCIKQYQTTPVRWYPKNVRGASPTELVYYNVGEDECPPIEDNSTDLKYCNGPLKSDTSYYLVIRLFTSSGYTDLPLTTFQTDSVVKWYLVVLLVLSCLVMAFLSGFIYMWANKKILKQNESTDGIVEQTGDVTANNFFQHYQELSKPEKIQREFRELTALTNDLSLENTASKTNAAKNRYTNIFPYDKNRVILDIDEEGSDYINASFINGYKHKKEFIATQGPKPETFLDFWRMVLQHNVYIIVMVTRLKEGETTKCHQYFPPVHQEMQFGNDISVSCIRETSFDTYVKREFKVEHTGEAIRKPVLHFFFKRWPDHDCPSDTSDLINFIRSIRTEKIPSHSPITVHCSAGVGRTGTFIALDIIMRRLKIENKINVYETVKKLRFQRMRMVQTVQQYTFLYACAHDLVKSKRSTGVFKRKSKIFSIATAEPRQSFSPTDIESPL